MFAKLRWRLAWWLCEVRDAVGAPAYVAVPVALGPSTPRYAVAIPLERGLFERFGSWMGGLSRAAAAGALNFLSGLEESYVKPAELYLALCTVVPTSSSTGETITEATGATGYLRIKLSGSIAKAVEGTKTVLKNNAELTGAAITAGSAAVKGWAACTSKETGKGKVFTWGSCTETTISASATPPKVASEAWVNEIE